MNYERINWEDGTQVKGAYVEIDGTRYPVVMPTYNCNTPITATNLNIMDKGIYNLSKKVKFEEIPLTILINNLQGSLKAYRFGRIVYITGFITKNWGKVSSNVANIAKLPEEYANYEAIGVPLTFSITSDSYSWTFGHGWIDPLGYTDAGEFSIDDTGLSNGDGISINFCYVVNNDYL